MPAFEPASSPASFRFYAHRERIDWGALHGVDADAVVRRKEDRTRDGEYGVCALLASRRKPSQCTHTLRSLNQAARTDVDALERCVAAIAFGDLDAEAGGRVSEVR